MKAGVWLRWQWRESIGARNRFLFLIACLAVGVASIVSVAGLATSLDQRIRRQARELVAADLTVRGLQSPPESLAGFLERHPELESTRIMELVTVASAPSSREDPGRSHLVELKIVEGVYPFYGEIRLRPQHPLGALLTTHHAVVAPDLLPRLGLERGDELLVGGVPFRIVGLVEHEPDRIASPLSLGPRVFLSAVGFARTELEQLGSRIVYRTLIKLPEGYSSDELDATAEQIQELLGDQGDFRVETFVDSQEDLRRGLRRLEGFLALVALLSLLLGGVGVAQTTRAWLATKMDDVAILRCLGVRPNEVLSLFLGQATLLGLLGSLLGVAIGIAILALAPHLMGEPLAGIELDLWQPAAMGRGLGLGVGIALLFSSGPLLATRRVPPLLVLRKDVEVLPRSAFAVSATGGLLLLGIWLVAAVQARSSWHALQFTAGVALAALVLALLALLTMRLLAPGARHLRSLSLRHGLLALARPGSATLGTVVSLGLGVLLVLGLELVQRGLDEQLRGELPAESPTAFLINIQPRQWPDVEELLEAHGARDVESVPIVSARLRAIDQAEVSELAAASTEDRNRQWALTREQRLTYLESLPADNRVVAGSLWCEPDLAEVSVEEEFASELGVGLGSRLRVDIQGVPLELTVTSLRSVDWRTFGINFFLVVEPGVLEAAPQQRVATARLPPASEQRAQDELAARFPNITLLKIREVLERVAVVLGLLARGIRFVGAFSVLAGIIILAGGVSADSLRRSKNLALLKTLGMTQWGLRAMLAIEFALIGALAGSVGVAGGSVLAWAVLTKGFEVGWTPEVAPLAAALLASVLLTAITGVLASRSDLKRRPAVALRAQ